ncbi:MAG: L,D-transpeptidase family protein [Planctomycetes bacterium]|nr:L,D-transpeptidase family protein [Planctomycetota bacterium]
MARRRRISLGRGLAFVAVLALIVWALSYWQGKVSDKKAAPPPQLAQTQTSGVAAKPQTAPVENKNLPEPVKVIVREVTPPPANGTPEQIAKAEQAYRDGTASLENKQFIAARKQLSQALASDLLSPQQADQCRQALSAVAKELIFSRNIYPDDQYAWRYVVAPGDTLTKIAEAQKTFIPYDGIRRINGIADPRRLQVGQWLKLVRGPFDVVITKGTFTLDLYHHGMFVKSYRIGLGQNGSTPAGKWIVRPGGRVRSAPWTPPPPAQSGRIIECGQPGYPLGKEGLWIALQGVDENTKMLAGFGIHGTNEPDSIGQQASLGCIRLADADIAELFDLLCDGQSRVEVRP